MTVPFLLDYSVVVTDNNINRRVLRECVNLCDKNIDKGKCSAILKMARNWLAHQGIKDVGAFDVAFVFHVMVHSFFDMKQESEYREWDRLLVQSFCQQEEQIQYKSGLIDGYEQKLINRHKNAYYEFVDSLQGLSSQERNEIIKTGYPREGKKKYSFKKGVSLFDTVSALGNSLSPERDKVSMQDLYILFLGNRKNDSHRWEPCLEQELIRQLKSRGSDDASKDC